MKFLPPPGPARTRQLALLGVLVIVAAYALSRLLGSGTPTGAPPAASNLQTPAKASAAAAPAKAQTASNGMPQPLKLAELDPVPELPETTRDPFRYGVKPPPPAPPAPPYVPPPPQPSRPVTPPAPTIPPITLRFVGRIVLPDNRVVAELSDGKGGLFKAMDGQIVDGRYRVVRIGQESLQIEYVDGTGRITLPLRGS